ncbi:MAG: coproporphyrinogen dehydrogenase [Gammaproteobacteria bacterium]|nr:coproporphyrinogen dehydrogenase [Gammaproteobacteria bacterium]
MSNALARKYNVPGPRYTGYPPVPFWDQSKFDKALWMDSARRCFTESNIEQGVSVHVHLPDPERCCRFRGGPRARSNADGMERPYIDALGREWALYSACFGSPPRVKGLHLGSGAPAFFTPDNLSRLMDSLVEDARITPPFDFSFEACPGSTTEMHLRAMRAHGFTRLTLDVQDFDPLVQRTIDHIRPFEQVARTTETARRLGYTSVGFVLNYGLPRQRLAGIVETMTRAVGIHPDRIAFFGYAHEPHPATMERRRYADAEIPRGEQRRALYEIGRDLLLESGYLAIGTDHFALETDTLFHSARIHDLHRDQWGYTPFHTRLSIGLGMAAISDAWYALAQNARSLKDYLAQVDAGGTGVSRGHQLTHEDLTLRQVILDLMCRYQTRLHDGFDSLDCAADCMARLEELSHDGLIEHDQGVLRVTDRGRPFVRNVCMAFDPRLWRHPGHADLLGDIA